MEFREHFVQYQDRTEEASQQLRIKLQSEQMASDTESNLIERLNARIAIVTDFPKPVRVYHDRCLRWWLTAVTTES